MQRSRPKRNAPEGSRHGTAVVILFFAIALASAVVSCGPGNRSPIADAGEPVSALVGDTVVLNGNRSADPDGEELTHLWDIESRPEGSEAGLSGADSARATLTPDVPGDYVISLVVSDGKLESGPDRMTVGAKPWFTILTNEAGVPGGGPQPYIDAMGPGAAWADYDGDGDLDLYVTAGGPNMLYRNEGDGGFTDVASQAGVDAACNSYGVAWGDYDSDGDLDMYVVCHSQDQMVDLEHRADEPNVLYRNNGDGTFSDVAQEAGVDHVSHGTGAMWGDYNSDGRLDLYVASFGIFGSTQRMGMAEGNVLYQNNGDGTFRDVTEQAGVRGHAGPVVFHGQEGYEVVESGMTFGGIWFDFDNDAHLDLLECNDQGVSPLYRSNGDGTFTDVTEAAGLFRDGSCMGVDAGDYDRDGYLDVYWTNYRENYLWHNNGDGTFSEVAEEAGVADAMVGWATGFADFDNDGLLDIFVTNGLVGVPREETGAAWGQPLKEPNLMYRNNGDGTFADVSDMAGFGDTGVGRGAALADYDDDGDLDIYVVNADGPNILYRNDVGNRNNWVKLRFEGKATNRDGFGVRIRVDTEDWSQVAEVQSLSNGGYLGGNAQELHCGLGQIARVKQLILSWPSGVSQTMTDVPVNRTITIAEPEPDG